MSGMHMAAVTARSRNEDGQWTIHVRVAGKEASFPTERPNDFGFNDLLLCWVHEDGRVEFPTYPMFV